MHDVLEDVRQVRDSRQVRSSQTLELFASAAGEREVNPAVVEVVAVAADQTGALRTLSELDRAVVAYVQLLGGLADRRARRVSGWPRRTSSSWCSEGVRPASWAACSLQRRNSRSSLRNASSRW